MCGGTEFSFGGYTILDMGDYEGSAYAAALDGFFGARSSSGHFVEGELRLKDASNISEPTENNGLRDGQIIAFRFGTAQGGYSVEALVAAAQAVSGDNDGPSHTKIERQFVGLAGACDATETVQFLGMLGRLDGDNSTSTSNADAFYELNHLHCARSFTC